MKIRNGFVSNSSSSSFLLISNTPIKCPEDLAEMIAPSEEEPFNALLAADHLWNYAKNVSLANIISSLTNRWCWSDDKTQIENEIRNAQNEVRRVIEQKQYALYLSSVDDSGEWGFLETGDFFPSNTIRMSEH